MFQAIKGWFAALSLIGKIGITAGAVTALGVIGSAGSSKSNAPAVNSKPAQEAPAVRKAVIETKTVTEHQALAFETSEVNDTAINRGTTVTRIEGANGERTLTYEVTYTDGAETNRKLVSDVVTTPPVTKV